MAVNRHASIQKAVPKANKSILATPARTIHHASWGPPFLDCKQGADPRCTSKRTRRFFEHPTAAPMSVRPTHRYHVNHAFCLQFSAPPNALLCFIPSRWCFGYGWWVLWLGVFDPSGIPSRAHVFHDLAWLHPSGIVQVTHVFGFDPHLRDVLEDVSFQRTHFGVAYHHVDPFVHEIQGAAHERVVGAFHRDLHSAHGHHEAAQASFDASRAPSWRRRWRHEIGRFVVNFPSQGRTSFPGGTMARETERRNDMCRFVHGQEGRL
mmetsp:Transcript_2032/g.13082  ORF Transcript_2032/g.13082 Transcript_2032/m.13082 type:complete len:264 (-) Transcript_2032:1531-2322(-)